MVLPMPPGSGSGEYRTNSRSTCLTVRRLRRVAGCCWTGLYGPFDLVLRGSMRLGAAGRLWRGSQIGSQLGYLVAPPESTAPVASSPGPSWTASSGAVHEVAPGPSAATNEYGQPGIIFPAFFPRPCTWQNIRSGLVRASGRSQLHTSAASRVRPSGRRLRQAPDRLPQLRDTGPARVQRVINRPVTPPVPRGQRQPNQDPYRPVRAQHRVRTAHQPAPLSTCTAHRGTPPAPAVPARLPADPRRTPRSTPY